jgi:hypothetical protein
MPAAACDCSATPARARDVSLRRTWYMGLGHHNNVTGSCKHSELQVIIFLQTACAVKSIHTGWRATAATRLLPHLACCRGTQRIGWGLPRTRCGSSGSLLQARGRQAAPPSPQEWHTPSPPAMGWSKKEW